MWSIPNGPTAPAGLAGGEDASIVHGRTPGSQPGLAWTVITPTASFSICVVLAWRERSFEAIADFGNAVVAGRVPL